jgi:hypothetical protein
MSKAPERCLYCDGQGNSKAGGDCGFCDHGKPLDTQENWDNSWGRIFDMTDERWGAIMRGLPSNEEKVTDLGEDAR